MVCFASAHACDGRPLLLLLMLLLQFACWQQF
jgi:hypothetical protein